MIDLFQKVVVSKGTAFGCVRRHETLLAFLLCADGVKEIVGEQRRKALQESEKGGGNKPPPYERALLLPDFCSSKAKLQQTFVLSQRNLMRKGAFGGNVPRGTIEKTSPPIDF